MRKRALLFSGGVDKYNNYPRYANDLLFTYKVLTGSMGFNANEIEILYADGTDLNLNGVPLKTNEANKQNFKRAILSKSNELESNDIFLLVITNHGYNDGLICTWGAGKDKWLTPVEVEDILNQLCCVKLIIMGQCYGGDYTQLNSINNSVILSANKPGLESYVSRVKVGKKYISGDYDEFICNLFSYYNGEYPSGNKLFTDSSNKSILNAFEYARQYDGYSPAVVPCIKINLKDLKDIQLLNFRTPKMKEKPEGNR